MSNCQNNQSLSPERRKFVKILQRINHGYIQGLRIKDSEPMLEPPPKAVRTLKFPGSNSPRPEIDIREFVLKANVKQFFEFLDSFGNGVIDVIEVRDGLPVAGSIVETSCLN